jgi:hypothetical protein
LRDYRHRSIPAKSALAPIAAERRAAEIRVRAERRCGELLKEMPKAPAGRPRKENPSYESKDFSETDEPPKTLTELCISNHSCRSRVDKHLADYARKAALGESAFEEKVEKTKRAARLLPLTSPSRHNIRGNGRLPSHCSSFSGTGVSLWYCTVSS